MIDISDGVLADFSHIAEQSAVGGSLFIADLPLSEPFQTETADFPAIAHQLALSGGEDYELCFTADRTNREKIRECMEKCGIAVTRIGIVTTSSGVTVFNPDGSHFLPQASGYTHF